MGTIYDQYVIDTASKYGVPPEIALSVMRAESSGNPGALSPVGAIGLFQLMPATAKDLGVDPYDPHQNIEGGIKYLSQLHTMFADWGQALAAYNFGPGNVSRGLNWPQETLNYVNKVLTWAGFGDNQQQAKVQEGKGGTTLGFGIGVPPIVSDNPVLIVFLVAGAGILLWYLIS